MFTWEWFGIDPIANVREWDPPWWAEESEDSSGFPWFTFFLARIVIFGSFNNTLTKNLAILTYVQNVKFLETANDIQVT